MKGSVVVGDVFEGVLELSTEELTVLGGFGVAILSPTLFGAFLWLRDRLDERPDREDADEPSGPRDRIRATGGSSRRRS